MGIPDAEDADLSGAEIDNMTTIRGLTINSAAGGHYAVIVEESLGDVSATIWQRVRGSDRRLARLIHQLRLECPFDVACARVHAIIHSIPNQDGERWSN